MKLTVNFVHNGVEVMENHGHADNQNLVFEDADHFAAYMRDRFVEHFGEERNVLALEFESRWDRL